jgi:hypothetical protein
LPVSSSTLKSQWLSSLQSQISDGLDASLLVRNIEHSHLATGRIICQELWPFIKELPDNISLVRNKLPFAPFNSKHLELEPASKFLGQLADDERHFQGLYLKQCELAGLDTHILMADSDDATIPENALPLVQAMRHYCLNGSLSQGVEAIVAAELAASSFARVVLASFESYFAAHVEDFGIEKIEQGLSWLRYHAKPNIRHAIWMKKMLDAFEQDEPAEPSKNLPAPVNDILNALFRLWRCENGVNQI